MVPARIVAFGSSSVYGRGDPDGGGFVGRLRRWHEERKSSNSVYNLGMVGDTAHGMVSRFAGEVSIRKPDLILFYPGINDIRRVGSEDAPMASSAKQFRLDISSILDSALEIAPTIMISSIPMDEARTRPWRESGSRKLFFLNEDAINFTDIGRFLCHERKITYFGVFESWSTHFDSATLSADGLHGTPQAHAKLFEELKAFLSNMFREEKD